MKHEWEGWMRLKLTVIATVTAILFAYGADASAQSPFPSPVDSMTTNNAIKILPAGQKLCAQAQEDCTNITASEFGSMAARLGMPSGTEVNATGKAALREAQGTCDSARIDGVFQSGHNLGGVPTAVYLFPYQTSSGRPVKWGTGFVCVPQKH
jgi:hypothetical protein